MKKFTQMIIGLMFVVGGATAAFAQSNNGKIVEQIMKTETEYNEASKKMSAEEYDRIEAADFMMTARVPPRVVTKAEGLARIKDPNYKRGKIESLANDDVKVRVYGDDTAIVTANWKRTSKDAAGIRAFQRERNLPETGEIDAALRAGETFRARTAADSASSRQFDQRRIFR